MTALTPPATLAANIAALTIQVYGLDQYTGQLVNLTIRSLSTNRPAEFPRNGPLLFPSYRFVTARSEVRQGAGLGADNVVTEERFTLNWLYAHTMAGAGRNPLAYQDDIDRNCQLINDAIVAAYSDLGATEIIPAGQSDVEIILDPNGTRWYGAILNFNVLMFRNL